MPKLSRLVAALSLPGFLMAPLLAQEEPPKARNLIPDGSFEGELREGRPLRWRPSNWGGTAEWSVDEKVAHTGKRSLRIESTTGADVSWSFELEVEPHTRYALRAWIKTEKLDGSRSLGAFANLHQLQMEGKTPAVHGTSDWQLVESTFDSGAHNRLLLNMTYGGWGRATGTAWWDDVEVIDLTPPARMLGAEEQVAFFRDEVRPILERRCFECHGPDVAKPKGELRLFHRELILRGGESGPAVNTEDPRTSLLLRAIQYDLFQMPPTGKLPADEIATLTEWVRLGAPWDPSEPVPPIADHGGERAGASPKVDEQAKAFWSFRALERPAVPTPSDAAWRAHPIDAFVKEGLEQTGLTPQGEASREVLIRRATFDLTGLPPTPEEVRAFVEDRSPDAWEQLIERLLASEQYGVRYARHWLDLVRYAETNSFERDGQKPEVWRYRDWVVDALNRDLPYDRFAALQLAGDELPGAGAEGLIASGFYRLGVWDDEPADPALARADEIDDIVSTTGQAFLGLTLGCARCHDHKIDPLTQKDYYSFAALFAGTTRYGIRSHESFAERSLRTIASPEDLAAHAAEKERHQQQREALRSALAAIEELAKKDFAPVEHEEFQHEERRIDLLKKRVPKLLAEETLRAYEELTRAERELRHRRPRALEQALCITEEGPEAPPSHILIRGNPHVPGKRVEPAFPEVLSPPAPAIEVPPSRQSTGRRTALARWITSEQNPLAARVIANRLWHWHFGKGLVRTPSDFGYGGDKPTHPELLDWLACEVRARGFSLKAMHRLILSSRTYRMASSADSAALAADPLNTKQWRHEPRRLSAEEVRDAMLAVNATLNPKLGGRWFYSEIPPEVLAGQSRPGEGWGQSSLEERRRRSLYIHVKRSLLTPILQSFDMADTDFPCPVRFATTQPTQALSLMNGTWVRDQAKQLAEHVRRERPGDLRAEVELALARTWQRAPKAAEIERGLALIETLMREDELSTEGALEQLCLVLLNTNEFFFID
ncbi:MAG: DUF1549 domain-containing protein [Planctomycetes bacterium]|nr:DUF1549 domain-containing protein [Planctomycetota bacterium]